MEYTEIILKLDPNPHCQTFFAHGIQDIKHSPNLFE